MTARRQSSGEDIIGIVGKRAVQEVGHHESTAAVKRSTRVLVNRRVTLAVERLVGISLQNIVGNTQRRSIVGSEGLPARHLTNGTVRGAENIRRESHDAVDHQGGLYFIIFLCCVLVYHLYCIESKLSSSENRFVSTGFSQAATHNLLRSQLHSFSNSITGLSARVLNVLHCTRDQCMTVCHIHMSNLEIIFLTD